MCYVWHPQRRIYDQNTDTATPTKQNVTDRELDPTKPQSTGNDKFKTQLSTETLTLVTINPEFLVAGDGIKNDPNCLLYSRMFRRFL
jgi:hypothetical protein